MGLSSIVDRLTAHRWTGAEVDALVGTVSASYVAHAADAHVREQAASGGAISALLISLLDSGRVDGALVCVTSVEGDTVRARYRIARNADEVLAARGSTYVEGDFASEAMDLIRGFDGRLAVVALPCEVALVRRDRGLDGKIAVTIALFCGHTMEKAFVDRYIARIAEQAGASGGLTRFRFRSGHWRGRLSAEFGDGTVIDKPSNSYLLYHNLYFGAPKKCMFCGDHFGYSADISAGDLWSQKFKNDPVKHTALIAKTTAGSEAIEHAAATGALEISPVAVSEILDGQRRTAPFHFNVTARSKAGASLGMRIPDKTRAVTRWHERASAKTTLKNHLATRDAEGVDRVLNANRRGLKARLYVLKGLESMPTGPLVPGPEPDAPRFSIIAATVYGNRGAEAMLETTVGRIRDRFPDACFSVFSYYPERDAALVRDSSVAIRSSTPGYLVGVLFPLSLLAAPFARILGRVPRFFPRSVRELGESEALVDLAGVSFIDGREKFLPFNVMTIWPAMLLGTPVFKLAQAMGPFTNPLNRLAANLFLRRCRMVVPRGDTTLEHLESITFPTARMHPAPDVAFLFESRYSLSDEGTGEAAELATHAAEKISAGRSVVGLCPSAVLAGKAENEGWDYIGFMADVASGLIADGHGVLLFPNATRARSEKLRNNDIPVIASIVERVGASPDLLHVTGDMSAASLRIMLESCTCAAVSRFHAMVGALAIGVPVCVVGWSHKYLEVMSQFGLEEFVFDYSAHDPQALRAVVNRLIAERASRAEGIAADLPRVQAESRTQFEELFARLED